MTKTGYTITFVWIGLLLTGSYFGLLAGHDAWQTFLISLKAKETETPTSLGVIPPSTQLLKEDRERLMGGLDSLAEGLRKYQAQLTNPKP